MLILLSSTIKTFISATRSITFAYYNVFKSFIISNFELFKFNFKESLPSPYILISCSLLSISANNWFEIIRPNPVPRTSIGWIIFLYRWLNIFSLFLL
jgi:hypothetical protein